MRAAFSERDRDEFWTSESPGPPHGGSPRFADPGCPRD
jgi:hypothetical protein